MAPPKDIARSYPKRGLTADVGFRSEPKFCGDGSTEFDGSADYLLADSSLNGAADLSYLVWVNLDSNSSTRTIVGENSEVTIYLYGNKIGVWNLWGTLGAGEYAEKQATNNAPTGQWIHIGVSFTYSSNTLKLYIDGVDQPTVPSPVVGPGSTSGKLEIGARDNSGSPLAFLDGKVANVKRFNVALTQAQIRELYNNPGLDVPTGVSSSNLKRHYKLDTNFNDSGADSENLTAFGSPSLTVTRPQLPRGLDLARGAGMARVYTGRCVDFDGSTDFLDMGFGVDKNYTTRSDRASFSVWFNTDQTSATSFIYQNRTQIGGTSRSECETHLFTHPSLGLAFDGDFASILIPITAFKIGQWHHFVGIADDTDGPIKAYLDGVLYDTTSIPQAGANGSEFCIGARNKTPVQVFNGQLSNFKIFNVELTQDQVRELYHNPEMVIPTGVSASNLRRHYPLCAYNDNVGMGGRYEIDQGVEGVNGEYGGSPVMDFAQPVPCPQLGLQQSATRLYFPANVANYADFTLGSALGSSFSYATWIQPVNNNSQGYYCLFTSGASDQFSAYILSAGTIEAGNTSNVTTTETVTLGDWTHIVITGDSSSPHAKIYINGSPATLSGTIDSAGMTETGIRLGMRGASSTANRQAHCIFAESAFWDVDLSPSEVSTLYNSGVMGYDTSSVQSSQLKAWHKYDDFTTLKDFSGEGRNATVSGTFAAASFPENASGSTIVGDFSMKRKGVSVVNLSGTTGVNAIIPNNPAVFPTLATGFSFTCALRRQEEGSFGSVLFGSNNNSSRNPPSSPPYYNHQFLAYLAGSGSVQFNVGEGTAGGNRATLFSTTGSFSGSEWVHFGCSVDYTTSPPTLTIYKNGAVNATNAATTLGGVPDVDDIHIGGMTVYGIDTETAIANPRFYQAVLSPSEMEQAASSDLRLVKGLANE